MQPQPSPRSDPDRPALQLAADTPPPQAEPTPAERSVYGAIADHLTHRAMVVADPENHLIAALLNVPHAEAAAVLALVEDGDLQGYLSGVTLGLIRHLVDDGQEPIPQKVITRARGPLDITPRPSWRSLALYVAEVYTMRMPVRSWCAASDVVEDAYRRNFEQTGTRMAQMAAAFADIDALEELTDAATRQQRAHRRRVDELRRRALGSGRTTAAPPPAGHRPPGHLQPREPTGDESPAQHESPAPR